MTFLRLSYGLHFRAHAVEPPNQSAPVEPLGRNQGGWWQQQQGTHDLRLARVDTPEQRAGKHDNRHASECLDVLPPRGALAIECQIVGN
jgi:hypothetical protein